MKRKTNRWMYMIHWSLLMPILERANIVVSCGGRYAKQLLMEMPYVFIVVRYSNVVDWTHC